MMRDADPSHDAGMASTEDLPSVVRYLHELPGNRYAPDEYVAALTFDDGPHPEFTPRVLDALEEQSTRATFFVVGENVERHPGIASDIAAAGHTMGCHGWSHIPFTELAPFALDEELDRCIDLLGEIAGRQPRHVRPPYGVIDASAAKHVIDRGLVPVNWSVNPDDWQRPGPDEIVLRVVSALAPSGIVVLHDGVRASVQTAEALPTLVTAMNGLGYSLVAL